MHIYLNSAWHLKDNSIFKFVISCPISRTASSKALTLFFIFLSIVSRVIRAMETFLDSAAIHGVAKSQTRLSD